MTECCRRWVHSSLAAAVAALLSFACGGAASGPSTTPVTTLPSGGTEATAASSCRLGAGSAQTECGRHSSRLADHVLAAMDRLLREKPGLFDTRDEAAPLGSGNYRVLDPKGYIDGLIANLHAAGLCAQRDPDDYSYEQIQVKSENGFSEDFDVLLGSGHMWHNGACYRRTCTPASFPVERGADLPPVGSGCGRPYPPPVHHFWASVHMVRPDYSVLDSTPVVGVDGEYCAALGYSDGRLFCAVRPEGHPERLACENWRVGNAEDNNRPGPTWRRNGRFCSGPLSGCENHPDNQYQLIAYKSGDYTVCGQNGACGQVAVER